MALLDNIPNDPAPLVITLDFSDFENGAKYSTMFRQYFDRFKDEYELNDGEYAKYIAMQLLIRLQQVAKDDVRAVMAQQLTEAGEAAAMADAEMNDLTIEGVS